MKKIVLSALVALSLVMPSFGQARVAAGMVSLDTNDFSYLFRAGTNVSLYHPPFSRTSNTVQHLADWIDDLFKVYWPDGYVMPGTNMYDSIFTNNQWLVMKGTNIFGAYFNPARTGSLAQTWYAMRGTNIVNGTYDTNSYQWNMGVYVGTNSVTNFVLSSNVFTNSGSYVHINGSVDSTAPIVPIGAVMSFARSTAPHGWLICDGTLYNAADYPALYAVIGSSYGSAGANTFRTPDLRGEFVRGWDNGRGVDTGRAWASWQSNMVLKHTHTVVSTGTVSLFVALHPDGGSGSLVTNGADSIHAVDYTPDCVSTGMTILAGGDENRPRNLALLYCIKY